MTADLEILRAQACTVARKAGQILRQRPTTVHHKGAIDLVTEIDLASEACIREEFSRLTPDIPVQGEEGGGQRDGLRWVVDPLDGTTNFVHGYPFYCVSIGLCDGTVPLVGCIYDPIRDRCSSAAQGKGAWIEEQRLKVSETRLLKDAIAVTGFPYSRRDAIDFYLGYVAKVLKNTQGMRRSGSAAMDLATLAAGQADFFWEFGLNPWDTAAGAVLVQEAGGVVCRLDGSPWIPEAPEILACNPYLRDEIIALLSA
jgi:myo-inositol-1(or 4)-monophosphatase